MKSKLSKAKRIQNRIPRWIYLSGVLVFVINCLQTAVIDGELISEPLSTSQGHVSGATGNLNVTGRAMPGESSYFKTPDSREQARRTPKSPPIPDQKKQASSQTSNSAAVLGNLLVNTILKKSGMAAQASTGYSGGGGGGSYGNSGYGSSGISPSAELQSSMQTVGHSLVQLSDSIGNVLSLTRHLTLNNVLHFLKYARLSFMEWFFIVFIPSAILAVIIEFVHPVLFLSAVSLGIFGHAITQFFQNENKGGYYYKVPYKAAMQAPMATAYAAGSAQPKPVYQSQHGPAPLPAMPMGPVGGYSQAQYPAQRLASIAAAYAAQAYQNVINNMETTTLLNQS